MKLRLRKPTPRTRRDPEAFLHRLRELDELLASRGFPHISPRWWKAIERFYRSGKRRLVVRKGRRVGASTIVAPRLAVAEALWGEHVHTPGSPPLVFAFVSVRRGEAAHRLRGIRAILDVLGERYRPGIETIELEARPVMFTVVTASFRTAVGDTVAFAWLDEVARWRDEETGANPASEVVGAITPALATLPEARLFLVSSPLSEEDYHAQQFRRGDDELQVVEQFATWEGNPTLSREECERLEPDPRTFAREFEGIPTAAVSAAFEDIDQVVSWGVRSRPYVQGVRYAVTFDAGENRSQTVALAFHFEHRRAGEDIHRALVVDKVDVLKPQLMKLKRPSFDDVVGLIHRMCIEYRVTAPRGDRHVHTPLGASLAQRGLSMPAEPMGLFLGDQARRSRALIDRVRAGSIDVVDHEDLVRQLRGAVVRERGGHFIVTTANKRTVPDDALDALLLACDEQAFGALPATGSSPGAPRLHDSYDCIGGNITVKRRWVIDLPGGGMAECAPPPGSREWRVATAHRHVAGHFSPEEMASGRSIDDFKAEAMRVLTELEG